jgi:hypothetical protein
MPVYLGLMRLGYEQHLGPRGGAQQRPPALMPGQADVGWPIEADSEQVRRR